MINDNIYSLIVGAGTNTSNTSSWSITTGTNTTNLGYWDDLQWHTYGSCSCNWYHYWPSSPTTIYKYELKCPRCKTRNWGEVNQIITCSKKDCGARLKAVQEEVDFEIAIN